MPLNFLQLMLDNRVEGSLKTKTPESLGDGLKKLFGLFEVLVLTYQDITCFKIIVSLRCLLFSSFTRVKLDQG